MSKLPIERSFAHQLILLREALEHPQQEPVAVYQVKQSTGERVWCDVSKAEFDALVYFGVTKRAVYTSPPARKPLTDKEVNDVYGAAKVQHYHIPHDDVVRIVRATEYMLNAK